MLYLTEGLEVLDFPEPPEGTSQYYRVPGTRVPRIDLETMTLDRILDEIYAAHLRVELVEVPSVEEVDTLLSMTPESGASMGQGGVVTIEISIGIPEEIVGPILVGLPVFEVDPTLNAFLAEFAVQLNWVRQDVETPDPTKWGRVVATDPPPGALVKPGDTIIVSVGVQPST